MPSSAEIIWWLANQDEPKTREEIAEGVGAAEVPSYTMTTLTAHGLLERDRRENGIKGQDPHEYWLSEE